MSPIVKRHETRRGFGRNKGRYVSKSEKSWLENMTAAIKERKQRNKNSTWEAPEGYVAGRRVVELEVLAGDLWCIDCDIPLSLRFVESEIIHGLASILMVKCSQCKVLQQVLTNKIHLREGEIGRPRYAVNYKAAIAIIDGGSGEAQMNTMLSALNIPPLTSTLLKRYERTAGLEIEAVATHSCEEAIALEKSMTIAAKEQESSGSYDCNNDSCTNPEESVSLTASIDAGWQKRGTGRSYNSCTGHSTLIGYRSGKILSYATRTKKCRKCEANCPISDHDCRMNFTGSAKAMEPDMAVELVANNPLLEAASARIGVIIADDDSSTLAAVRRESSHRIEKWSDFNHAKKGLTSSLYLIKLPVKIIEYFGHSFSCAIKQNKGDVEAVRRALLSIVPHAFGEHETCGEWCRYDPNVGEYLHENLPNGKALVDPEWRISLTKVFQKLANNAERLAPCGSSQANESLNNVVSFKHPKNHHYAGSESFQHRVAAAICQKNIGMQYILNVHEKLSLSPGFYTKQFRENKDQSAKRKAEQSKTPEVKRRRLFNKRKRSSKNSAAENREGLTYSTECDLNNTADLIHDAPAVGSYNMTFSDNLLLLLAHNQAVLFSLDDLVDFGDSTIVVFDLETSGLSNSAQICQIAAAYGDNSFEAYMLPSRGISASASAVTGLTTVGGELFFQERLVNTTPPRTAMKNFIEFLLNVSDKKGVILVAHNGFRFDVRVVLRTIRELGLFAEFTQAVKGFADTLPLFREILPDRKREKKKFSQVALACDYLGPAAVDGAHNAVHDVRILSQLIATIGLSSQKIKQGAKSISHIIKERDMEAIHTSNKIALEVLKNGVSPGMRTKIAKAGITITILEKAFKDGGKDKIRMLLAEDVGGRPRVTKNEKVLNGIIGQLELLNK